MHVNYHKSDLRMFFASNMQEEAKCIIRLFSAKITFEWILAMVAHVYSIHGAILEGNSTKFTRSQLRELLCSVDGHETWHVTHFLLRVGVQVKPPLYLVRLALPPVLGGGGGEGGAAGVGPGVAATLIVTGATV